MLDYQIQEVNGKCGIVNENGTFIVKAEYEHIHHLLDDLFVARIGNNDFPRSYGVINLKGEVIIPFKYIYITKVENFILCSDDPTSYDYADIDYTDDRDPSYQLVYFIDLANKEYYISQFTFTYFNLNYKVIYEGKVKEIVNDLLVIIEDEKLGVVNSFGDVIIIPRYYDINIPRSNRFIVKSKISDSEWYYGVIDDKEHIIIPFEYNHIESKEGFFYRCRKNSDHNYCEQDCDPVWLNKVGFKIFVGEGYALSSKFLCVKNNKYGIINQKGNKVVNFIYDAITSINDYFVVRADNKVGVLGKECEILINPSYSRIRAINLSNTNYHLSESVYTKYSYDHLFDSDLMPNERDFGDLCIGYSFEESTDFVFNDDLFYVLENEDYSEILSLSEGILPNSRFEEITALSNVWYAFHNDDKWGVFNAITRRIQIPCDFDRLIFDGYLVMLNKGQLWGAISLDYSSNCHSESVLSVDIPVSFNEIKVLDLDCKVFSVKVSCSDTGEEYYTIIDSSGNELHNMCNLHADNHYTFYNNDRILSYKNGKYGFISLDGYITIPFRYDYITDRGNRTFNVRIDDAWGVLDISGKEIIQVKYTEEIPLVYNNHIVRDVFSRCYGILNEDGIEYVPAIYQHIMFADSDKFKLIYVGYNGVEQPKKTNFFSGNIASGTWGCLNEQGNLIIQAKYDCFLIEDDFILAGRNGKMMGKGYIEFNYFEDKYGGIFDLFDGLGNLIFGGFTSFFFDKTRQLYFFQFGGSWDTQNDGKCYNYSFIEENSRWLILDREFNSVILNEKGKRIKFPIGFIGDFTNDRYALQDVNCCDISCELFSVDRPEINYNLMICGDNKSKFVVRLENGVKSREYSNARIISNDLFFYSIDDSYFPRAGIASFKCDLSNNYTEEIILEQCSKVNILTDPVEGFVFSAYVKEPINYEYPYTVVLYDLNNISSPPLTAIEFISESALSEIVHSGGLFISIDDTAIGLKRIMIKKSAWFHSEFLEMISSRTTHSRKRNYWFSSHELISYSSYSYNENWKDELYDEYRKDTWYALTDGMYGDMPDGYDCYMDD